ncbi:tRNA 2-thiouridine(34) synthase MnmA [Candidatus Saccharibacteria bacterium CG11_big_fil_rev_8_21_14_0_20_41_19]|nr:tRNA 2-thiouridine(34) synthase MnmA [Candidatus Saccharibacteria bacterium]OIP86087.1 MAG: tRNA 2-thiouridine(34) synthase MnmA [Candidatus Saccharibacteria bacterium CG2_30_41_52]PIQ70613.1 MAG: tRNA 2-thiouridine(34) synthase MnmA [Candidatus Saccharibacteria bacterium CG11_big_fil_rev_8_21_14_0_20_41_19]PIZ60567.1 MAG: tRNA 2-thiouridine(34) synthase MnmA [Candidatus Saccharibacteria bacterium CG_4_10_14_0_2_um_filter_41_11]PJE66169.1 MAG: tRNA 2-thiouridine(34) synthase MnmA [Candidatus
MNEKTKVYVGMSGGVDSSLSAALLIEQGYDVTGIYMKNWTADLPGMKCPWADDLADAKRVAVQLGIDFKVFDFENEYKHKVVDYMIEEYKNGRTPNPDIMCNQEVKFKLFLDASLADGADMIATGHYARVENDMLKMAVDVNKDQTYFLYRVTGEALAKTLFPIGEFVKPDVRKMALERGLSTAAKKDSQGICFVGQVGIRDFLSLYVDQKPGAIIDKKTGKTIGHHDGAIFYTLGQRHGLELGGGLPYYVIGKDMNKNEVYVTTDLNDGALWENTINLRDVNWINQAPENGTYQIRVRHRAKLVDATLESNEYGVVLRLDNPERAVAAGQSVVIYKGDICLGGGIIA